MGFKIFEPKVELESTTYALRMRCSTNWSYFGLFNIIHKNKIQRIRKNWIRGAQNGGEKSILCAGNA